MKDNSYWQFVFALLAGIFVYALMGPRQLSDKDMLIQEVRLLRMDIQSLTQTQDLLLEKIGKQSEKGNQP